MTNPEEATEVKDREMIYQLYKAENSGEQTVLEVLELAINYGRDTASVEREMLESFCQFRHERLVKAYREFDLDPVCESDEVLIDKFLEERAKK